MTRKIPSLVLKMVDDASADAGSDTSPFWFSESAAIAEEGMYLLGIDLDVENTDGLLAQLPSGYKILYSIFNWERSRAGEGFMSGTKNSGAALVYSAAESYDLVGMREEANALRSMLA